MTASNEALRARPTPEQIETSLRRIGTGQVRRCIPAATDDDDVVLSNAVEHLTADLAAAREALARVRRALTETTCLLSYAANGDGALDVPRAHAAIRAARALLDAEPRETDPDARVKKGFRIGVEAAAKWVEGQATAPHFTEQLRYTLVEAIRSLAGPRPTEEPRE